METNDKQIKIEEIKEGNIYIIERRDGWSVMKIHVWEITKTSIHCCNLDADSKFRDTLYDFNNKYKIIEDLGCYNQTINCFMEEKNREKRENKEKEDKWKNVFKDKFPKSTNIYQGGTDDPMNPPMLSDDNETLATANGLHDGLIS